MKGIVIFEIFGILNWIIELGVNWWKWDSMCDFFEYVCMKFWYEFWRIGRVNDCFFCLCFKKWKCYRNLGGKNSKIER